MQQHLGINHTTIENEKLPLGVIRQWMDKLVKQGERMGYQRDWLEQMATGKIGFLEDYAIEYLSHSPFLRELNTVATLLYDREREEYAHWKNLNAEVGHVE